MASQTALVIRIDPRDPDTAKLRSLVDAMRKGKLVAFPTETVYGIGGPMDVPGLAENIARVKSRDPDKPLSYHISDFAMVERLNVAWTPELKYLARHFWPGPLTLLVSDRNGKKVGLRFPRQSVTAMLIQTSGMPFLGTSANVSGQPSPVSVQDVMSQMGDKIDFIVDGGITEWRQDSTIVDLTENPPVVVRPGADAEKITKALDLVRLARFPRKKVLFVCTGNSCRSPMAEGWLIGELRKQRLIDRFEVASCGTGARFGAPPSYETVLILKNREVDISGHRARPCSREELLMSDLIFCMSEEHAGFVQGLAPEIAERVRILHIPDPIGMGMLIYEQVLAALDKKLKACWQEIVS